MSLMARVTWCADTRVPSAHIGGSTKICVLDTFPTCSCLAHAQKTHTCKRFGQTPPWTAVWSRLEGLHCGLAMSADFIHLN